MKVKNILGPDNNEYPKGFRSWTEYWVKNKHKIQLVINWPACNTTTRQEKVETAHVLKVDSKDKKEYIIPLCEACAHRESIFTVDENLLLSIV